MKSEAVIAGLQLPAIDDRWEMMEFCFDYANDHRAELEEVDLLVFPDFANPAPSAEMMQWHTIPGKFTEAFSRWARQNKIHVAFTLAERGEDGFFRRRGVNLDHLIYESAVLIDPRGEILGSRRRAFSPHGMCFGESVKAFDSEMGKIGLMMCGEGLVHEVPRLFMMEGAEILVWWHHSNNKMRYPWGYKSILELMQPVMERRFKDTFSEEVVKYMVPLMLNAEIICEMDINKMIYAYAFNCWMYVMGINYAEYSEVIFSVSGEHVLEDYGGRSCIAGPRGLVTELDDKRGIVRAKLDLEHIRLLQPVMSNQRRPELYEPLLRSRIPGIPNEEEVFVLFYEPSFRKMLGEPEYRGPAGQERAGDLLCEQCGRPVKFMGYKERTVEMPAGPVEVPQAYFYCSDCNIGIFPFQAREASAGGDE